MTKIAIVGAGMAGLAAARRLEDAGIGCTVIEKSRGLGGRMATRLVDGLQFDHGAQYFTARGARFQARVAEWQRRSAVSQWMPGRWVGTPGMTAPARSLAGRLRVIRGCRTMALEGNPGRWMPATDPGSGGLVEGECFDAVILAIPAPQVIPLAASAGAHFPELERVRYAPCLTLMLAFEHATYVREHATTPPEGPVAWIARNGTKPGRTGSHETLVAHANPEWSYQHIDADPESIAEALLGALRPHIGTARPVFRSVHRWLYARVEETAGVPFLWDSVRKLGACGDWAVGPRVEAAFDSGEALAVAMLETLA